MSFDQYIDPNCKTPNPLTIPAGQNRTFPWLSSYVCQLSSCDSQWYVCSGSCGMRKPKLMRDYTQVRRHDTQLHKGKTPVCTFEQRRNAKIDQVIESHTLSSSLGIPQVDELFIDLDDNSDCGADTSSPESPPLTVVQKFQNHMVSGNSVLAAATLVSSVSKQTQTPDIIPVSHMNIYCFCILERWY